MKFQFVLLSCTLAQSPPIVPEFCQPSLSPEARNATLNYLKTQLLFENPGSVEYERLEFQLRICGGPAILPPRIREPLVLPKSRVDGGELPCRLTTNSSERESILKTLQQQLMRTTDQDRIKNLKSHLQICSGPGYFPIKLPCSSTTTLKQRAAIIADLKQKMTKYAPTSSAFKRIEFKLKKCTNQDNNEPSKPICGPNKTRAENLDAVQQLKAKLQTLLPTSQKYKLIRKQITSCSSQPETPSKSNIPCKMGQSPSETRAIITSLENTLKTLKPGREYELVSFQLRICSGPMFNRQFQSNSTTNKLDF